MGSDFVGNIISIKNKMWNFKSQSSDTRAFKGIHVIFKNKSCTDGGKPVKKKIEWPVTLSLEWNIRFYLWGAWQKEVYQLYFFFYVHGVEKFLSK